MTKYRSRTLDDIVAESIDIYLSDYGDDITIVESECDKNHLHILCEIPPNRSITKTIGKLKGRISKRLGPRFKWSPSFFITTVGGAPLEVIKQYIINQNKE